MRWLDDEGKAQVQLEDGRLVAVADPQNVIREPTRGAGVQRKNKRKEISRIKRAGGRKGPPKQEIQKVKQKRGRQTRTAASVPRTPDPKIHVRTKIMKNNNNGRNKGPPNTMGPWASDRGVMSLKIYSTKRETIKLIPQGRTKARYTSESLIQRNEAEHKTWGERPTPSKINTKGKKIGPNGWWKTPIPSRYNTKRIRRKGSTDVYLQKRSIELEID